MFAMKNTVTDAGEIHERLRERIIVMKRVTIIAIMTVAIIAATVVLSPDARAAETNLMEVSFDTPVWRELLKRKWGNADAASLEQGTLRIQVRGAWHSRFLPYRSGTKIAVSIRAKSAGIEPMERSWNLGRVVINGYDGAQKSVCHYDLTMMRGDTEWKTYVEEFEFPAVVKFFVLSISNSGKSGVAWFDDLRVSVRDKHSEHLMGDSGFEGRLGADHWFHRRQGLDWDNLQPWSANAVVEADLVHPVAGKRCVSLTGTSTLVSKPFPYDGEKLVLSGWLRTRGITKGKRGWCIAGVQVAGLDEQGKCLVHTDLKLEKGTTEWTFYQTPVQFHGAVKQVQIWVRVFDGAGGTAWFDEVALQRISADGQRTPFNAETATFRVDALTPGKTINHRVWTGLDVSYIVRLGRKDQQAARPLLEKIGMQMIRVRELAAYSLGTYNRDDPETGRPVYRWDKLDALFDLLVRQHNFIPNVTIETTPPALARKGTPTRYHCNRWPPTDYDKWGNFVEAIFEHFIQRYGKEEVEKWYWEVWNEPMASGYYKGTPEEFVRIAEQAYLASDRVEKRHGMDLRMGLTSGGAWMNQFVLEQLKEMDKLHLIEHYTEHLYLGARSPLRLLDEHVDGMKRLLKKYPDVGDCELGVTEWNCNSMGGLPTQKPWNATCVIKTVRMMLDAGIGYSTFNAYFEYPHGGAKSPTFSGSLAMIALNGVPKPVYNAFVFLHELRGGVRLTATSSNNPIDGLAVLMPDGAIRIVLTSYDEDTTRQPYETEVTVEISGAPRRGYRCVRHWAADDENGNSYGKWLELGKPPVTDAQAKAAMLQSGTPARLEPVAVTQQGQNLRLSVTVPSPGIRFLDLVPSGK